MSHGGHARLRRMNTSQRYFALDIEADGPCAGLYSMVSFAVVPMDEPEAAFYSTLAPLSDQWDARALAVSGFTREQCLAFEPAETVMRRFRRWAEDTVGPAQNLGTATSLGRAVLVSDNPGFDAGFLTYYCVRFGFDNPFGHSCRRLGDLCAGMQHRLNGTRDWKRWTRTAHTHCALDDAKAVAEGWLAVCDRLRR